MQLKNKPRGRSNSTCPDKTYGAQARARARVLENSTSDPENRKYRTLSAEEEEDFKFLESYVEKIGPRPEVSPVYPKNSTFRPSSTELKDTENSIETSRETKIKRFKNHLPKFPFKSPMPKRKLGRSFSETKPEPFQDYHIKRNRCTKSLDYNLQRTRYSNTNSLDFYRTPCTYTDGFVSSNSRSSSFESEFSTCSLTGSIKRISSGELIMRDTIKMNVEKLEELAEEIDFLNTDLTNIVEEEHDLLNTDSIIPDAYIHRLGDLNLSAQSDIQRACLAYQDYMTTIKEIGEAIRSEEVTVLERAFRLKMESETIFQKVTPMALERPRGVSTK